MSKFNRFDMPSGDERFEYIRRHGKAPPDDLEEVERIMSGEPFTPIDLQVEAIKSAARDMGWGPVDGLKAELSEAEARHLELQERYNTLLVRDYGKEFRIEALRAASRVAAPFWAEMGKAYADRGKEPEHPFDELIPASVKQLADQFLTWLEG
jgi:hypothetical protein